MSDTKPMSFVQNSSRGIRGQAWPIRLADFILRKFAGLHLLKVRPRSSMVPSISQETYEASVQFLGETPEPLKEYWAFLQNNKVFLAQGRAFGCQLGMTREMRQLIEYHFGDEAKAFFKANPVYEVVGATTPFLGPEIAIARLGSDLSEKDFAFVVAKAS